MARKYKVRQSAREDLKDIGRLRDDIREGYYCKEFGKHVIFYLINDTNIEIVAVLHEAMMPQNHL